MFNDGILTSCLLSGNEKKYEQLLLIEISCLLLRMLAEHFRWLQMRWSSGEY